MKHKRFFTALATVLYLAVLSFASFTPVLAEEIDWEQLEAKAERILKAEGHDVSGILRVEGEIAPQSDSGLASDEYWIMFYDTREGDLSKYRIRLTDQGVLTGLDTDNPEGKGVKIINDPDYRFVDAQQLKTGREAARSFLQKYNRSICSLADELQADQILIQDDAVYYTLVHDDYSVIFRVCVEPEPRIEYYSDYR